MRGKKWIIIAVVLIVGLLSGYVICCYSQSDSLTDALALYGGKENFEMVDTLRAGNITYNVFLKMTIPMICVMFWSIAHKNVLVSI